MKKKVFIVAITGMILFPIQTFSHEPFSEKPSKEFTLQLNEYSFNPKQVTLPLGENVELTLENRGTVMHEFITDAFKDFTLDIVINGVITEALGITELEIPPGASVQLLFTPAKKGNFPFFCESKEPKNHLKEGMQGNLVFQ